MVEFGVFVCGCVGGAVTFPVALRAIRQRVMLPLRVRAHHRVLGTLIGSMAVITSGFASGIVYNLIIRNNDNILSIKDKILTSNWSDTTTDSGNGQQYGELSPVKKGGELTKGNSTFQWLQSAVDGLLPQQQQQQPSSVDDNNIKNKNGAGQRIKEFDTLYAQEQILELTILAGTTLGLYLMLGGRPRRECPSCLWSPGAFAVESMPANRFKYATNGQKKVLQALGKKYGCHSCGTRNATLYHGDHIPPSKVPNEKPRVFLPQCPTCSARQGVSVKQLVKAATSHVWRLQSHHLWVPIGPILVSYMRDDECSMPGIDEHDCDCDAVPETQVSNFEENVDILLDSIVTLIDEVVNALKDALSFFSKSDDSNTNENNEAEDDDN
eukprot:m.109070 g.109070  ORF g.109070 m.109070 type:complete len:382 (-) comp12725_c0_seq1:1305-2450(-)